MRATKMLTALCLCVIAAPLFATPFPKDTFPDGYESWEKRTFSCQINKRVVDELRTYTERGAEAVIRVVSAWRINGKLYEAKYFEKRTDEKSLSGYRVIGFTLILDHDDRWVKLGGGDRLLTNNELLYLRVLRHEQLERHGTTEREETGGWATCNNDRPGLP